MRTKVVTSPKGLNVRGIAGTYVVLLAFDCPQAYCNGLAGFGIQRTNKETGKVDWLTGLKKFDRPTPAGGDDMSSEKQPIQKFHWGDYTVHSGQTYTYKICAMRGTPGALTISDSVEVTVTCEVAEKVGINGHAVHFNRSAAASQAFAKHFPNITSGDVTDPAARSWLSRGHEESLIAYIDSAKPNQGLHLFLYEFEKDEFHAALKRALDRGVRLEILYDKILHTDTKTKMDVGPSLKSEPKILKNGLKGVCKGRTGSGLNISHNKFMVLSDVNGSPLSVWTGSTNFTDGGIYGQTNMGHAVTNSVLAGTYFQWHQAVWAKPDMSAADSRKVTMQVTPLPKNTDPGVTLVLSPRSTTEAIDKCVSLIQSSSRMVCFTAPFPLHNDLEAALAKAPSQVFGLLNKDGVVGQALHDAPNTQLAAAGAINEKSTLESWQKRLLSESAHHSGVFIHTKILLLDPLSDNPIVVTGSANFSTNSSKSNDENQLYIFGEKEVADIYLGEFMRMFDHYYYRTYAKKLAAAKKLDPKTGFLDETDGWSSRYFGQGERVKLREAFFS